MPYHASLNRWMAYDLLQPAYIIWNSSIMHLRGLNHFSLRLVNHWHKRDGLSLFDQIFLLFNNVYRKQNVFDIAAS